MKNRNSEKVVSQATIEQLAKDAKAHNDPGDLNAVLGNNGVPPTKRDISDDTVQDVAQRAISALKAYGVKVF